MRIAVCDDERAACEEIVTLLEDYSCDRKIDFEYETFTRYEDLEPKVGEFDLFFVDYEMPEKNGMDFSKDLWSAYGEKKTIIFVTAYDTMVYESMKVRAFRYILKPIDREQFYEALDSYFATNKAIHRLTVRQNGQLEVIVAPDISYISAEGKTITFNMSNGSSISCRETLDNMEEKLDGLGFFRVHRQYIVNLKMVESYMNNYIVLKDGTNIKMSSRRYNEFRQAHLKDGD